MGDLRDGKFTTTAETNSFQRNCLPPPETFCIQRVGVFFDPESDSRDRAAIARNFTAEFRIGDKIYFRCPVASMFEVSTIEAKNKAVIGGVDLAPLPLVIVPLQAFYFDLSSFGPQVFQISKPLRVWTYFEGQHARGVQ